MQGDRDDLREEIPNTQNSKMDDSSPFQPFLELNHAVGMGTPDSSEVEKDRGLGDSLSNTANSSLISLCVSAVTSNPQPSHVNQPSRSALAQHFFTLVRVAALRFIHNVYLGIYFTFDFTLGLTGINTLHLLL